MEKSLVKLRHFWEWSMINIVDGFERIAVELMNNVNEIIKIRSTLEKLSSVTEYIMFVEYILFNWHFSKKYYKNTTIDIKWVCT